MKELYKTNNYIDSIDSKYNYNDSKYNYNEKNY